MRGALPSRARAVTPPARNREPRAHLSRRVVLVPDLLLTDADDDEVPRVPGHSKARQKCLARQYSGDDALPADCKVPWHPIG
jgi:hypothetical protein